MVARLRDTQQQYATMVGGCSAIGVGCHAVVSVATVNPSTRSSLVGRFLWKTMYLEAPGDRLSAP
jgi:hypothetical protein